MDEDSSESIGEKRQVQEKESQKHRNQYRVNGGKQGVNSKDKVKHIERNDKSFVVRMMWVNERKRKEMKSECCGVAEQF